jgi:hypothetical protein
MNQKPLLRVLTLYGAPRGSREAIRLLARLSNRFASDFQLEHIVYPVNSKHRPWEKEWTPRADTAVEIFILALGPNDDLPPCLKRWLNALPEGSRAPKRALVLMDGDCDPDHELTVRRRSWSIGLADRKGMDFFSSPPARRDMFQPNFSVCPMVHPVSRIMGPAAGYALSPLGAVHQD